MITACQLCEKVALEAVAREALEHENKVKTAKAFVEVAIAPIVAKLTTIPENLLLGYVLNTCFYTRLTDWTRKTTDYGNTKYERYFTGQVTGGMNFFDINYVADYLAEFGFRLRTETQFVETDRYTTSTCNRGHDVTVLYLSLMCPAEESKNKRV